MQARRRPTAMTNLRLLTVSVMFAVLGALLISCGDRGGADPGDGPGDGAGDLDITYVVTGVTDGGEPRALVRDSEIRLRFENGRLGISAGCNTMSGRYTLDGTRLSVTDLSMTEMGCDAPLMDQDSWVAGLFAQPVQLSTGAAPTLISGDVVLALSDREQVSPDRPLVGTTWSLDSIGSAGADGSVSSVPQDAEATLTLDADGTFRAEWYCGAAITGTVVQSSGALSWTREGVTQTDCPEARPGVDDVARALVGTLTGPTTYRIEEKALWITKGERSLGFRAE